MCGIYQGSATVPRVSSIEYYRIPTGQTLSRKERVLQGAKTRGHESIMTAARAPGSRSCRHGAKVGSTVSLFGQAATSCATAVYYDFGQGEIFAQLAALDLPDLRT